MEVRSLGYRTDLAILTLEGSQVTDCGDHLVIRTPGNPDYWWAPRGHTPVARVSGNSGRMPVAGMACLKPGRPGRFFYRLRVHRRRPSDFRSAAI